MMSAPLAVGRPVPREMSVPGWGGGSGLGARVCMNPDVVRPAWALAFPVSATTNMLGQRPSRINFAEREPSAMGHPRRDAGGERECARMKGTLQAGDKNG